MARTARAVSPRAANYSSSHGGFSRPWARRLAFPEWVPPETLARAGERSVDEAESVLAPWLELGRGGRRPRPG